MFRTECVLQVLCEVTAKVNYKKIKNYHEVFDVLIIFFPVKAWLGIFGILELNNQKYFKELKWYERVDKWFQVPPMHGHMFKLVNMSNPIEHVEFKSIF